MTHPTDELTYLHPGYKKPYPIETVLRDLAAQEGCDGEPYDAMVFAARAITALRAQLAEAWARLDYWCERSVEWDAEMLQKDREVLEAIARSDRAKVLREAADRIEDYCSDMPDLAGHGHSVGLKDAILTMIDKENVA